MTSRERVRAAITHSRPDQVPAAFEAVGSVTEKLMKHYGFTRYSQLLDRYGVDVAPVTPRYIGPKLKEYTNEKGELVKESYWGFEETYHTTNVDTYATTSYFPFHGVETVEDVEALRYPDPDWFDYDSIREQCEQYPDKAIITGHEGPFQIVTYLIQMDEFFMLMIEEPETAERLLERMVEFELEYYRRILEAGQGRIDIIRPHDDYGTQISLLFGVDMWKQFFMESTKKLTDLVHQYGAFYQQHSCGAVRPLIPYFIQCGVDVLEPVQKVRGLEPESLQKEFGGRITFHGGIDTQDLLPHGTADEVRAETERFIRTLHRDGGYILMSSQAFEGDVPIENIEALYDVDRRI
ncbi:uroporphyrinogen decarboxylase family protein [Murimonas intestini]|uniref:uroporphyrinogen decarboxylase family protein n=1 Tax=Murimonas intestini TaxID=1337051 RepID=UPI0011DCB19C|nr:uroporphyrinogen decarboxylase family protein [Murimonas intestini]